MVAQTVRMARLSLDEIRRLSVAERVELVEEIWETIEASPDSLPIPEAQRQELDRRLKLHLENPGAAQPWSSIRSRLTQTE
jgi:putative addiction module component (TIGR02574 family)